MGRAPKDAIKMYRFGKRWMWEIDTEGRREINALHVPIGKPVKLNMISQDVIHDFSIPDFRIKMDVRPGWYSQEWFVATTRANITCFASNIAGRDTRRWWGRCMRWRKRTIRTGWRERFPTSRREFPASTPVPAIRVHRLPRFVCPDAGGVAGRPVDVIDDTGRKVTVIADEPYLRESIFDPAAKLVVGYPDRHAQLQG